MTDNSLVAVWVDDNGEFSELELAGRVPQSFTAANVEAYLRERRYKPAEVPVLKQVGRGSYWQCKLEELI
jgi:hypothetical protein